CELPTVRASACTVGLKLASSETTGSGRSHGSTKAPPLPSGHFQQITFWFKWLGFYQERDFFSPGFTQYTRARKDKLEIIRRAYDRLACQVFGAYLPKPNDQMVLFFCEKQKRQEK
ncbi:hypothetical protein, partial [Jeotgalibaca porci]|uniref:hypothetical protein n=1 Tax=Jeotgalibaca porci TaxID=1868793 RepID=UPI00359FA139